MPEHNLPVSPYIRPSSFNFATDIVDYWSRTRPDQFALYWTDQTLSQTKKLTYTHFSRQSHRIASLFHSLGLKEGDICVIILPRIPEWWEVVTACLRSGIILCPCTTLLVDKDIEYRLQVSHATAFVGDDVSVKKVLRVRRRCETLKTVIQIGGNSQENDVVDFHQALSKIDQESQFDVPKSLSPTSSALIFFTSGTTGNPKIVLHSQISYPLAHSLTGHYWLQLSPTETYWNLSEQGWAKAAWSFFGCWTNGATLFVHDDRQAFSPLRTLEVLHKFPITVLCAPPTVYRQLVLEESQNLFTTEAGRPKALKHCCGAGEPLNESVIRTWKAMTHRALGKEIEIYDGYGQTETILVCANQKGNKIKYGSMGKPLPGVPLVVVDSDGKQPPPGQEGDIAIEIQDRNNPKSFFGLFDGYIDRRTGEVDQRITTFNNKKYYLTGDRATRDEEGYFWFVGRSDDVINSSGYRIGPFEVESTLKQHPAVVESAVVASPDPQRDEVVKAFVVLTQSESETLRAGGEKARTKLVKDLQDFCKENAAPYKYPRKVEFVDASFLPKTISGKIRRVELRKLEKERYQQSQNQHQSTKSKSKL